jgi:cytochrome c peroxidase
MIRTTLALVLAAGAAFAAGPGPDEAALLRLAAPPLGLPPVALPPEGEVTAARVALGRKLFMDRRLSANGTMSCAMCHIPEQGFTSHELGASIGVEGRSLRRNAPTVLNVAYVLDLFHDGREPALETQALAPLIARDEMANPSLGAVVARLRALPDYAGLFEAAFGAGPSPDRIGRALAAWQRTLLAAESPFDRWRFQGEPALTPEQIRGFELFSGKAGCAACHTLAPDHALFTDHLFHDTGTGWRRDVLRAADPAPTLVEIAPGVRIPVPQTVIRSVGRPPQPDQGRIEATGRPEDLWRFRTPSLRNVAVTAPYLHDGSLPTLEAVVRYYDAGGAPSPGLDPRIRPLELTEAEIRALVAFLESLTASSLALLAADARSIPPGL